MTLEELIYHCWAVLIYRDVLNWLFRQKDVVSKVKVVLKWRGIF